MNTCKSSCVCTCVFVFACVCVCVCAYLWKIECVVNICRNSIAYSVHGSGGGTSFRVFCVLFQGRDPLLKMNLLFFIEKDNTYVNV